MADGKARDTKRPRASYAHPFVLFGVSTAIWMALWAGANPPGAAPDEPGHLVKAMATGQGELLGRPVPAAALAASHAFDADQLRQVSRATRGFTVPPRLSILTGPPCTAFNNRSGACLTPPVAVPAASRPNTIVGAYPPWLYAPGGVLAWFAPDPAWAYRLVRAGSVLVCAALLAAGLTLLAGGARRPAVVLAGAAVALTPMAVFLSSEAGVNGIEAVGGFAAGAAALRLSRADPPSAGVWWLAGTATAVAALSRPLAPVWTLLAIGIFLARLGPLGAGRRLRAGGTAAAGAAVLVVGAIALGVGWTQAVGLRTPVPWHRLGTGATAAWRVVPAMLRQAVGVFGWQDTPLPPTADEVWWFLGAALIVAGLVFGRWRDRLVLAATVVAVAGLYEGVAAAIFEPNGFGMQGRYILPALVMVPLVAAEGLADRLARAGSARATAEARATGEAHATGEARATGEVGAFAGRSGRHAFAWWDRTAAALAGLTVAVAALGQFVAFGVNARRYAVGADGRWYFLDVAQWSPPGGWWVWFGLGLAALAVGLAAAPPGPGPWPTLSAGRSPRGRPPRRR